MLDWFEFKGKHSSEYGVYVTKLPPITLAQERVSYEEAVGRSGSLTMLEGENIYDDVVLAIECFLRDPSMTDAMAGWLRGEGRLMLPNRPGGYYMGRVTNQIALERIMPAHELRSFTVSFRVQPYFYLDSAEDIEIDESGYMLENPGSAEAAPKITIMGSGDFSIMIGSQMVLLRDIDEGIVLDTMLQDALSLDGGQLLNDRMTGAFPVLPTGSSSISWAPFDGNDNPGSVSAVIIEPRWRCR